MKTKLRIFAGVMGAFLPSCAFMATNSVLSSSSAFIASSASSSPSFSSSSFVYPARGSAAHKTITKVESFPALPANYEYFDYKTQAQNLDSVLFSFASDATDSKPSYLFGDTSSWSPVGFWIDQTRTTSNYDPLTNGYLKRSFGMPTYIGDTRVVSSGTEPMTYISSVLGSSWAGIDKAAQTFGTDTYNFAEMTFSAYDTGSKLVHNIGTQGQSFWYDIFPQIMFARLYDLYPDIPYMKQMVLNGADQWLQALPYFVSSDGSPDYEFMGFNVNLDAPTTTNGHIEPPNGGLAFLFYSAYRITGDSKYLDGAKEVLDYLQDYQANPNYEAMTDYAPYVAAILNAEDGTDYDVGKFLDFLFDPDSKFRSGWDVMSGSFGSYPVDGLVGQSGDYAFAMNSLHLASTLTPLVKYDPRYADAIGRYLLNLSSNARYFFPHEVPLDHQSMSSYVLAHPSMSGYLPFDKNGSVLYEGFRNSYAGQSGYAMGDATTTFGEPCDLSVYSSAFIGGLGAIVSPTNVTGIIRCDLNATDSFGDNAYPSYLLYNPYAADKQVSFEVGDSSQDLFDSANEEVLGKAVSGTVSLTIPAGSSRVVRVLPPDSDIELTSAGYVLGDEILAAKKPSINFTNVATRQTLSSPADLAFDLEAPAADAIVNMKIRFGDNVEYDGPAVDSFHYDKSALTVPLANTDYTLRVDITTASGATDYVTKRVVAM
jgi:hypothetical protein